MFSFFLWFLIFLWKHFVVILDSVSPVLTLKIWQIFFAWISVFKKYLHNQGIQPHSLQLAQLYSTGIIMVNETAVHIFDIDFLFLSQSLSSIKNTAATNVMSLNIFHVHILPQKSLFTLSMVSFYKCLIKTSGTFTGFLFD